MAQEEKPSDTQHCIRVAIGNGLREQLWEKFQNRFQIAQILEFYASTEGNVAFINNTGKVGACGFKLQIVTIEDVLLKVDQQTGEYIRGQNGYCTVADRNEPGELVGCINKQNPFNGYIDNSATNKKILKNVLKDGDMYF